jgi:hypothetical protein
MDRISAVGVARIPFLVLTVEEHNRTASENRRRLRYSQGKGQNLHTKWLQENFDKRVRKKHR